MALDAGEVFVVVGSKLDSSTIARSHAALKSLETASNDYQKSIDRGEKASNKLHAANDRWTRAAVVGAKASAIGIAGVVTALAGAAVAASNFDASMRNVNSIAGLNEKSFKALEGQILRLSTAVGKGPTELADGLYSIVSSGFKAADAMKILTASARAARAGLTDTSTATTAITAVLNSYGLGANKARMVSDVLFQTVNTGVLNFEQLAGSLGKVLSPAASIGVSLKDLSGALAALTLRGNSADEAATQLGQTMVTLQKPGPALAKLLKGIGYESGTAAIKAVGFKGTLDQIAAAAKKSGIPLADLFGNVRALRGVQGLEGTAHAAAVFTSSVKDMDEATKGAGATQKVYLEQQKSTAAMFDHLKAVVNVAAITIGSALLPQINAGITAMTHWFAEAQKSGDIQRWASEIAHGVSEVVGFLHSLGPEASAAFHVVASTVQAAIPFVEALYKVFQTLEPAIEGVAHASAGLASALGPAPILAAVAAYLALRRATLTAQAAQGTFSKVMQAGEKSIASSAGGINVTTGNYTKVGREAIKASSFAKIAAKGIASSFGPQLLAAGAAGIILALVHIRGTMTTLRDEANQTADAMLRLNDARLGRSNAALDVRIAQRDVEKAKANAGAAAVAVAAARRASVAANAGAIHPGDTTVDPKVAAALAHQGDVITDVQGKVNRLAAAKTALSHADTALNTSTKDLADQYGGLSSHATGAVRSFQSAQQWSGKVRDAQKEAAQAADKWATDLSKGARAADGATKASIRTADGVAALARELGHVPTPKEQTIIVNGLKANRTLADIRKAVLAYEKLHPVVKLDADPAAANRDIDGVTRRANALDRLTPKVHLGTSGFNAVQSSIDAVNANILHLTSKPFTVKIDYATGKAPALPGVPAPKKHGTGAKTTGPEVALIGEDGPEYVIPVSGKYRPGGIALWMAAGKDLGIPGYAKGKKPGKTPPPVPKALGYDPQALDNQQAAEKKRLEDARSERDQLATRIKTDSDHKKTLEKQRDTAKKAAGSKNAKTAAAGRTRLNDVKAELKKTQDKIDDERKARQHQVGEVIPAAIKRYNDATRAASIGRDHQGKIDLWNARADAASNQMTTASNEWDAADRKKDPAGKKRAYADWDAARKERITDLGHVKSLLNEVMTVVGKTKYGAQVAGDLATAIGNIVQAQDDTSAPGYEDPTTATPSTDIDDYLYQAERDALAQAALGEASAAATADTGDDVTAANATYAAAHWILDRLVGDNAPTNILTQAFQAVADARQNLESAVSGNTPDAAGTPQITADQQAALDQQTAKATAAQANADSAAAALKTFQDSRELFGGGGGHTINVGVKALTADSPAVQWKVGREVVKALDNQGSIPSTTVYYRG